jgi:hypothetical protein
MRGRWVFALLILIVVAWGAGSAWLQPVQATPLNQFGTPMIPTVTGTPRGVVVTVTYENPQINVRTGPNVLFPAVGVLIAGQEVPAKGRTQGGDWILVDYPGVPGGKGWVYSYNVTIPPGSSLPVVESPPAPEALSTVTIDPTLASQFLVTAAPSRLPTFTPPPPLVIPTFAAESSAPAFSQIPMGLVIAGLGSLGIFLGLVSFVRGK